MKLHGGRASHDVRHLSLLAVDKWTKRHWYETEHLPHSNRVPQISSSRAYMGYSDVVSKEGGNLPGPV